ncbi:uncharacterized protein LOC110453577 [Mizuhopecten yessoensis]|uniref:Uncharacterized protein n=1 Tax=Mizuhopecten yessoensis TaxID=6573 RepID=A0A210QHJ3_MIZYE|nr:uncharacterized protein LOC110453577 [Mizuhopecten yessoensis]OWF48071.1 hypothetical protein KP79_PYT16310 [Mizuhopecten yessoensis]
MGCCFSSQQDGPTPKTRLLQDESDHHEDRAPPSSARHKYGDQHSQAVEFTTSVDVLRPADMKTVALSKLNKTFQDQAKLYDDLLTCFKTVKQDMESFKGYFAAETEGIPELQKCVVILVGRCGDAELVVDRKMKNCIQIEFKSEEILRTCTVDYQQVIPVLDLFNSMNKLMKKILDRAPQVKTTIECLTSDAHEMKKDIMKSDLNSAEGPAAMKACIANISKLDTLKKDVATITKHTERMFKDVLQASQGFFKDKEDN